jgi:hypothetical protein
MAMRLPVGELPPGAEFRTLGTGRLGTVMAKAVKRGELAVETIVEPLEHEGTVGVTRWLHPDVQVEVAA